METHNEAIQELIERAEIFGKSTVELYKLKAIDKAAETVSSILTRAIIMLVFLLFFVILNIGIALWIGSQMTDTYFGFFILSGFYAVVALILFLMRDKWIKKTLRNNFIIQALN
jgi:hypothetical protein